MKKELNHFQKIKEICRIMNSYPAAFDNKAKALALKQEFIDLSEQMNELISKLLRPASVIHRPKQDKQQKLKIALLEYIGMGILLATHLEDMPLLDILKTYRRILQKVSAYKLYEIALHILEELQKHANLSTDFGLTAAKLTEFNEQITDYAAMLDQTGSNLTNRRSDRAMLLNLNKHSKLIINQQLDPFMEFNEKEFPDLYREYMLVRGIRQRRKKDPIVEQELGDLSGVVINSLSGLPVHGAMISVPELEAAYTTDVDGYFLIDELPAGNYTILCSQTGYEVPESVKIALPDGGSQLIDFSLIPVAAKQTA